MLVQCCSLSLIKSFPQFWDQRGVSDTSGKPFLLRACEGVADVVVLPLPRMLAVKFLVG